LTPGVAALKVAGAVSKRRQRIGRRAHAASLHGEVRMGDRNRLEPLPDGFVAFRTEDGQRWRHRDIEEARTGEGYRLFISDSGDERRYVFGPNESHDATLYDLRLQLRRAQPVGTAGNSAG
jgi:hypothetical protein